MKSFLNELLDWIYKKKCYCCRSSRENTKMCSKCWDDLDMLSTNFNRIIEGKKVYCAGIYSKNLQKIIRGLKYHHQRDLAFYIAKFMYEYWLQVADDMNFQIVPVPIFEKRKKERKYNHMELVAEEMSRLSGMEINFDLVKRVKNTKAQYNLKRNQRIENLKNAFIVDKSKFKNKKILLIDDICTTGSTFEEIIRTLQKAGIEDIICLATTTPFED